MSHSNCDTIVTRHPGMLDLLHTITQVAPSNAPVLIQGETGTGKELVARAIHDRSPRSAQPLGVVHCAALPELAMDADPFDHAMRAFTGADRERHVPGTLFLDEVADIPLSIQSRLLRLMQFHEAPQPASDTPIQVELRIVATTHHDLEKRVREGTFRSDLYHRLSVIDVTIPPLRDRREDVPLLAEHFLRVYGHERPDFQTFTPAARALLLAHEYPGNVRELENVVQRCCLLARDTAIGEHLLPATMRRHLTPAEIRDSAELTRTGLQRARHAAIARAEREFLVALLERWPSNLSQAARASGLRRGYLQRLLSKHHLRRRTARRFAPDCS